jgi:hypothetical protein
MKGAHACPVTRIGLEGLGCSGAAEARSERMMAVRSMKGLWLVP